MTAGHPRSRVRWYCAVAGVAMALLLAPQSTEGSARRWGDAGHRMVGQAATSALPASMPAFFRVAGPQLSYLNPEPDRWRVRDSVALDPAMDRAFTPDHFVDLELLPPNALAARDRHVYAKRLQEAGVDAATAGFLPYRILELTERLRTNFRLWRKAPNDRVRGWIEERIINDAGILGHYVADAANPHHTSIHFNGWVGDNPRGFTTDRRFHGRFESAFVQSQVKLTDFESLVSPQAQRHDTLRAAVNAYIERSHSRLERLYELDKQQAFNARNTSDEHRLFAAERLAAGATMLRDLWWTAWVSSD